MRFVCLREPGARQDRLGAIERLAQLLHRQLATIGIKDVTQPDLGDAVEFKENEVPVFWACGVTPQAVAMNSKPPLMITHSPGYMFITDEMDEDLAVL